jgi:MFS family permease
VSAAALGCIGSITTLWQLYAFFLVFGFCYGGCGLVPISTIVARWFTVRRPQALAVASTGLSLGGIVATPVSALLVKQLGLAGAAPWLALAFFLGVVPVTAFIVRARPQAIGLEPDGARRTSVGAPAGLPGTSFAAAWRTRYFVAVTGAYMFVLGSQVGGIAHIFRLANLRVDTHVAAVALALFAAASLGGRLVSGWLLGRVPLRAFALALMASQSVALAFLAFATTKIAVLAGTALFGLTAGTILMMQQLLIADAFGARDYGRIYSVSSLLTVLGVASGPSLVGLVSETAGGYVASYAAIALASLAGLIVMTLAGPPRRA